MHVNAEETCLQGFQDILKHMFPRYLIILKIIINTLIQNHDYLTIFFFQFGYITDNIRALQIF